MLRVLLALLALTVPVVAQTRAPPAQRSGPIAITGPGSTGDVSGMSVTLPGGAVATLPNAFTPAPSKLPACVPGSTAAPVPAGQPFACGGFVLIAQ